MADTNVAESQEASSSSLTYVCGLEFQNRHNIMAFLNEDEIPHKKTRENFTPMLAFLRRCKVFYAISENTAIKKSQVGSFWNTVNFVTEEGVPKLKANVCGHEMTVTEGVIRTVLRLGDDDGYSCNPNIDKVQAILVRCGYPSAGDKVMKKKFCPYFRYLAHIMIHSLGSTKGGFDQMNRSLQSCMAALVTNMEFNYSRMIFEGMKKNAKSKSKFLQYPRFVQLLINSCNFVFEEVENDILPLLHMSQGTIDVMNFYGNDTRPKDAKLFGAIINPDYVCPPGDEWKHENSDVEDKIEKKDTDKQKKKQKGKSVESAGFEISNKRRKVGIVVKDTTTAGGSTQPTPPPESDEPVDVNVQLESMRTLILKLQTDLTAYSTKAEDAEKAAEQAKKDAAAAKKEAEDAKKEAAAAVSKTKQLEQSLAAEIKKWEERKMVTNDDGFYVDPAFLSTSRIDDDSSSSDDSPRRIEDTGTDHE